MYLSKTELYDIKGGAIGLTILNAVARIVSTIFDIGYNIGSSIRRLTSNRMC